MVALFFRPTMRREWITALEVAEHVRPQVIQAKGRLEIVFVSVGGGEFAPWEG